MKKIHKIIIIFLILLCIIIPNCFAVDVTINDTSTTLSDNIVSYKNYVIFTYKWNYDKKSYIQVLATNGDFTFSSSDGEFNNVFYAESTDKIYGYGCLVSNSSSLSSCVLSEYSGAYSMSRVSLTNCNYIYSSTNIVNNFDGSLVFAGTPDIPIIIPPNFITTEEDLKTGNFNNIEIAYNDYVEPFYLHVAEISRPIAEDTSIIYYTNQKTFYLGAGVSYYVPTGNLYSVPKSDLGFAIENGKEYIFLISSNSSSIPNISEEEIFQKVEVIAEERSENAILNDKMDIQNETNKGMWETLKDILSYINPFSENFFVYKLIEMLIEALKSLFIPQDGFLSTYFEELKNWFSDRLGFLFYPFELLIDILNKILGINFSEPVFNIPDINEPFTNTKLISATTFNFNSLLENNVLKTIHAIYLICLDAFIVFELVNLFRRKYEEVTTK